MATATPKASKTPSALDKYSFYTSAEYYPALKARIDATKKGDRIMMATLWLRTEWPAVEEIVQSLVAASKREVQVTLLIDAFHFLIKHGITPGPAFYFGKSLESLPPRFRKRQQAIDKLQAAGVQCQVINQAPRALSNPFRGRSHIKYSVVNDEVFIGGCNLSEAHFLDVMVAWQDKHIADQLCELSGNIMKTGNVAAALANKDKEIPIDTTTTLLIDAGIVGQSIILDRAHDIIDAAQEHLLITYQYFPHGATARNLAAAVKRGVRLRVFYNHFSQHKLPLNTIYGYGAWRERRRGPVEFSSHRLAKQHTYLHAKVLTSERMALLSSHNYIDTGVKLGTAEIGMVSTDPGFGQKLNETVLRQLK